MRTSIGLGFFIVHLLSSIRAEGALAKREATPLDRNALVRSLLPVICVTENYNSNSTIKQCWECFTDALDDRTQEFACAMNFFRAVSAK